MKVFINRQELTRAYNELQKSTAGIHCFGDTTFVLTTDDNVRLEEGQLTPKPERKIGMPPALGAPYGASQVNHPSHYNSGKIEVIEALEDWNLNFCLANTVKYIRATITSNFGNFFSVAIASLLIDFLPMLPLQILFVNLKKIFSSLVQETKI